MEKVLAILLHRRGKNKKQKITRQAAAVDLNFTSRLFIFIF